MGQFGLQPNAYNFIVDRNQVKWGSYGKLGNEPLKWRLVKDLSDSHLLHIIEHLKQRDLKCTGAILRLMQEEAAYRYTQNIFVDEYQ